MLDLRELLLDTLRELLLDPFVDTFLLSLPDREPKGKVARCRSFAASRTFAACTFLAAFLRLFCFLSILLKGGKCQNRIRLDMTRYQLETAYFTSKPILSTKYIKILSQK